MEGLHSEENQRELSICAKTQTAVDVWTKVLEEANSNVSRCVALATLTTRRRDFSKATKFNKPEDAHKSSDGNLECKDIGAEAQDYDWCISEVIAYEAMLAEEKLSQTKFNNDIQQLKASELATQDPNDPTAALKSQVKVLEMTKKQFEYKKYAQGIKGCVGVNGSNSCG